MSYRLRGLGHAIWCEPAAVVLHDRGRGTPELSFRGEGAYPRRRVYFTLRHRWLTIILHYRIRSLLVLAPALALYDLAAFLECTRRGWLQEWIRASWSLMRGLPRLLKRRQRWQDSRTIPDSSIISKSIYKQIVLDHDAYWLHEECENHPIRHNEFSFGELSTAQGMELNRVGMLKKWMAFRDSIKSSGKVCVTEGCLLHAYDRYFIHSLWDEKDIVSYYLQVAEIIQN